MSLRTRASRWALVVDDDAARRVVMCEGLLDHGVVSDEASTLEEAIGRLASKAYDVVVCDQILCDQPEAANPALRGYLVACFALTRPNGIVIQCSSLRRWVHDGTLLTNWVVADVADLMYGSPGIPPPPGSDGGCPWCILERAAEAEAARRSTVVAELAQLPIVQELEGSLDLRRPLAAMKDAADGIGHWAAAVAAARRTLFPGLGDVD